MQRPNFRSTMTNNSRSQYKQYKTATEAVEEWLLITGDLLGCKHVPLSMRNLAGRRPEPPPGKKYLLHRDRFLPIARFIARDRSPSSEVPLEIQFSLEEFHCREEEIRQPGIRPGPCTLYKDSTRNVYHTSATFQSTGAQSSYTASPKSTNASGRQDQNW